MLSTQDEQKIRDTITRLHEYFDTYLEEKMREKIMMDPKVLDEWFSYKKPDEQQVEDMTKLREMAKAYAHKINETVPDGPDKTFTIRLLRLTVMTHNLGIMFPAIPWLYDYPSPDTPKNFPFAAASNIKLPGDKEEGQDAKSTD